MRTRMAIALLSLAGVFVSLYLYLHKLGVIGELACGTGGCETVQLSPYAVQLGIPVPLIGVVGYGVLFGLAIAALQRPDQTHWPRLLRWLSGGALLFSGYLTYLELFVIHAICRFCVASAIIVLLIFVVASLERRAATRLTPG